MISFTLNLEAVAKGRPRFDRRGHAYTPARTRKFEKRVRELVKPFAPAIPETGPVLLCVAFFLTKPKSVKREFPTCRPDLDNLVKSLTDALNGVFWEDDSQVTALLTEKHYAETQPQIDIVIAPLKWAYTHQNDLQQAIGLSVDIASMSTKDRLKSGVH